VKKNKLLIIQNYNANKGDSSVITSFIESYRNPSIEINLTSYDTDLAKQEYNISSAEWLLNFKHIKLAPNRSKKIKELIFEFFWFIYSILWIYLFKAGIKIWLPRRKKETINFYINSEVVMLPGGHFFTSLNGFHVIISHYWALRFAQLLGKKTMIYAQTIGPFFGKTKRISYFLTKRIVKKTNIVTLRESDSKKLISGNNIFVTAETVFANNIKTNLSESIDIVNKLKQTQKTIIGVTIHHIYYKYFFAKQKYVSLMSAIFDNITSKGCEVLIIPMEANYHNGGDLPLAKEMKNFCKNQDSIHIIEDDYSPEITASIIAKTNIFIGTKTHSIVYGLKSFVPTISISYQQKSNEFMKMFNVLDNAIDLKDLDVIKFIEIFDKVLEQQDKYSNIQKESYFNVKKLAESNNKYLESLFNNE
jgi:colanic acid/amylovoran biosynthesis protein